MAKQETIKCPNCGHQVGFTDGWKGKSGVTVERLDKDEWLVTEHRKQKFSGKVNEMKHIIEHKYVVDIYDIINGLTKSNIGKIKYRDIISEIIDRNEIYNVDLNSFNGGHNRVRYMDIYYYPMKILESLGIVHYGKIIFFSEKYDKSLLVWRPKK